MKSVEYFFFLINKSIELFKNRLSKQSVTDLAKRFVQLERK